MRGLLVLNGEIEDLNKLKEMGSQVDYILSGDGGTDYCIKAGLIPDLVIGDLDSISEDSLNVIRDNNIPIEKFPIKKDKTDSELAVYYMIDKGIKEITLIGAIGSRMDHTLANLLLLNKMMERGVKGKIVNENNTVYMVDDKIVLPKIEGYYVSVIPVDLSGLVVSLKGFEYELDNVKIEFASTHGISNRITEGEGHVIVHKGKCFVIVSRE